MVEYDRTQERDVVASTPLKICVAGIGGAGLNVLDRITLDRIVDATLVSMHTDVRVLSHAMAPHKIQLGSELMRGIGSGGDPELGREAAEASRETIKSLVQGHDMVFICVGLGGGTASGAAPVVAEIAKECGALVFVFATMPFSFEGRRRLLQAEVALEEVQKSADALILFENNRMGELTLPKEGIQKAFSQADQLIGHSVRAIATMVTRPGIIQLSLSDLIQALRSPNTRCLFGFGEGKGTNRVNDALKRALKSPLVNQGQLLAQARNLLVHVSGGESLTLAEVEMLMKQLGKCVPDQTQILFGVSTTPNLGDSVAVTLISSLSAQQMMIDPTVSTMEVVATPVAIPAPAPAPAPVARAAKPAAKAVTPAPAPVQAPVPASEPEAIAPAPAPTPASAPAPAPVRAPVAVIPAPAAIAATPAPAPAAAPAPAPAPASLVEEPLFPGMANELELPMLMPSSNGQSAAPPATAPVAEKAPASAPKAKAARAAAPVAAPAPAPAPAPEPAPQAAPAPEPEPQPAPVAEIPAVQEEEIIEEAPEEVSPPAPVAQAPEAPVAEAPAPAAAPQAQYEPPVEQLPAATQDEEEESEPAILSKPSIFALDEEEEELEEEVYEEEPQEEDESPPVNEEKVASLPVRLSSITAKAAPAPESEPQRPRQQPKAVSHAEPALVGAGKTTANSQASLNLHQEEVTRFKGTEKTIVEGEDLDVPTWMRLKQRAR